MEQEQRLVSENDDIFLQFDSIDFGLGDPQEINAITEVFCSKRKQPLLIGSTKSNMGHPEPASGVAALAKLLIAIQTGHIPGKALEVYPIEDSNRVSL